MKRETWAELLRIVCMLMILTLHYLNKGGILPDILSAQMNGADETAWFLEALCYVSVNAFVLVTGYFLGGSRLTFSKLAGFWGQIAFYSIGVTLVFLAFGWWKFDPYQAIQSVLPVTTGHYWFATVYMLLLLLSPILNRGLKELDHRTLNLIAAGLVVLGCILPTLLPLASATDGRGLDILWFITLYLCGASLKRGEGFFSSPLRGLLTFVLCSALTYFLTMILRYVYLTTGHLGHYVGLLYNYNSITVFFGSLGLFSAFRGIRIREGVFADIIRKVASMVFGVYLLHEHLLLRYEWPKWFHASECAGSFRWAANWLLAVLLTFIVCLAAEFLRQLLFAGVGKLCKRKNKQN